MKIYFLQFWRLGIPSSRCHQIWCLVWACFLVDRQLSFCCNLIQQKGAREFPGVSLKRALIPFRRPPLMILITSQRPHPQITSHWELDFCIRIWVQGKVGVIGTVCSDLYSNTGRITRINQQMCNNCTRRF